VKKQAPRHPVWPVRKRVLAVAAIAILVALTAAARRQCSFWKDSITLFQHALAVTKDNHLAEHDLGMAYIKSGKVPEGLRHLHRAIEIKPEFGVAHANLAMIYCALDRPEEAWKHVRLGRKHGCELDESFLAILRGKMPDPGE
jgi:Flp pilus assembly protein TadD